MRRPKYNVLKHKNCNDFYYLIGLICTDGTVIRKNQTPSAIGSRCSIVQHTKQKDLLEAIKSKFGGIVVHETKTKSSRWTISDAAFVEYLINTVGIQNNKTHTLDVARWFDTLSEKRKRFFVRGVLDGDGNVFHDAKRDKFHKISIFSCSKAFITMLSAYFDSSKIYTQKARPNTWSKQDGYNVVFSGKRCVRYFTPIFNTVKLDGLFLKHKYNKFLKIKQRYGPIPFTDPIH